MANRFSLSASIMPTVDDRAAEREGQDLAETLEGELGDLQAGIGDGLDGVGGIGGGGGGIARGGGGAVAGAAGASSLAGGAASGGLAKVALGGVVGFGILSGVKALSQASPLLGQAVDILSEAANLFFRPFGNAIAKTILPFANEAFTMAENFNEIAQEDGLDVAVASITTDAATAIGSAVFDSISDIATGQVDSGDLFTITATGLTAKAILDRIPWPGRIPSGKVMSRLKFAKIGAATITGAMGLKSIRQKDFLGSIGWGTVTGAAIASAITFGTVSGGAIVGGLTFGTITGGMILAEVFGGGSESPGGEEFPEGERLAQRRLGRLADTMGREQAFQTLFDRVQGPEAGGEDVINRSDVIAAFRELFPDENPPVSGVPGGGGRTGDGGGPGDVNSDQVADDIRTMREVLENIEQSGGQDQLTSSQLQNILPDGVSTSDVQLDPYS